MDKLVIIRERWLRGEDPAENGLSWLVGPMSGKMCCLGFLGKQCGFTDEEMRGVTSPAQLHIRQESWPAQLFHTRVIKGLVNSEHTQQLMAVNDRVGIPEQEREAELIRLFAEMNIELEFTSEVQDG